jgi:hypothetical protein
VLLRRKRIGQLVIILTALMGLFAASSSAYTLKAAGTLEGLFESCDISTSTTLPLCEQRLQVMHEGGAQVVVMPIGDASRQNIVAYSQAAFHSHMKVMWDIANQDSWANALTTTPPSGDLAQFETLCGCSTMQQLMTYTIHWLDTLPTTYGYYAADDSMLPASAASQPNFIAYSALLKSLAGGRQVMISANAEQGESYQPYATTLGVEIYPVFNQKVMPVSSNLATWDEVTSEAQSASRAAAKQHDPTSFILQAFTFGDNLDDGEAVGACTASMTSHECASKLLYPSWQTQLELRNQVIKYAHPQLILWYSLPGTLGQADGQASDGYNLYPIGALAAARWRGLQKVLKAPIPT